MSDNVGTDIGQPHKPNRADEKDRIVAAGGRVLWFGAWRVNAVLAVSRSIGDRRFAKYLSPDPEINMIDLDAAAYTNPMTKPNNLSVVLASDGLWDVYTAAEVAALSHERLTATQGPVTAGGLELLASELARNAISRGSRDNVTVQVIHFEC